MTTICLECGDRIESRFEFLESIKSLRHLKKNHPKVYEQFNSNSETVTDYVTLQNGETVHLLGETISYEKDDGERVIEVQM